jgi:uncharacterized protein
VFRSHENHFFVLFGKQAQLACEAANRLADLFDDMPATKNVGEVEKAADRLAREAMTALRRVFITPLDGEQIRELVSLLDDIVECTAEAAQNANLYHLGEARIELREMTKLLVCATGHLETALATLRDRKNHARFRGACIEIHRIENQCDDLLRLGLARLFREEKDPIATLKWKAVLEDVEQAVDRCEDAAALLHAIAIEYFN